MSISLGFFSTTNDCLIQLFRQEVDFFKLRTEDDGTGNLKSVDLDFYTDELMELLGSGDHSLSPLLDSGNGDTELFELYQGILYDSTGISEVLDAFSETDLEDLANELGYPESEDKEITNSLYKTLNSVKSLFTFAKERDLIVIGYII